MRRGERMLEHIALDTNDLDSDTDTTEYRPYAVHEDFQSTVWGLSDTDGDILERYNYTDPYGVSDSEDAAASALGDFATEVYHRKRLHGGFIEKASELYDFRNRWLDPEAGGWLSRDPLGFVDSWNQYQAFRADPLTRTDRFGLSSIQDKQACFQKDSGDCPAVAVQGKICLALFRQAVRTMEPGVWAYFKALCEKSVSCTCHGCFSIDSEGKRTTKPELRSAGKTDRDDPELQIYIYYESIAQESSGNNIAGTGGGNVKCCPCHHDISEVIIHEGFHRVCAINGDRYNPLCWHPAMTHKQYDVLEMWTLKCLRSEGTETEACENMEQLMNDAANQWM